MKKNRLNIITDYLHNTITNINTSKFFAGLMIITLNIASKFVTIKLSKSMESYLKFTFSKQILVFAIAWMGTRDIYVAFLITVVFILLMDYVFNEESMFCCLPKSFMNYHLDLLENDKVSDDEIRKAKEVLKKADLQNPQLLTEPSDSDNPSSPNVQNIPLNNVYKNAIFPFSPITANML